MYPSETPRDTALTVAAQGTDIGAESLRDRAFTRDEQAAHAPAYVAGLLALSGERLRLVAMAVEEELDPELLHALHNEADAEADSEGGIVLEARMPVPDEEEPDPDDGKGPLVT
ncbi:hypothetical protein [Cystobacter fuscus]|uniref:hypothetical protein n=1 Tax=Cystobacter fuscus TaxID=43 RepID=UPI000BB3C41B|nr:hypothetical protein [Cystobacter fuscus]